MKNKIILCGLIATAMFTSGLTGCVSARHARISREEAQATALAQVPNGIVKDGELEKEHGKWIWSFDIATPGTQDIKEVAVDARSGKVLSLETETPEQQAREKAEDAAKEKHEKKEKD